MVMVNGLLDCDIVVWIEMITEKNTTVMCHVPNNKLPTLLRFIKSISFDTSLVMASAFRPSGYIIMSWTTNAHMEWTPMLLIVYNPTTNHG